MNISFTIDQEAGIDPHEPLGNITISDGNSRLSIESTYLDSWFDVLIDGLNGLKTQNKLTLEILEEPEVITFENLLSHFKITYRKQELFFSNLKEFHQALLISTKEFLSQLQPNVKNLGNFPILNKINHFLEESTIKEKEGMLLL